MKKAFFLLSVMLVPLLLNAQAEEAQVKAAVTTFFTGFHAQDSVLMKSVLADDVILQTTARDQSGKTQFSSSSIDNLMVSILSIPDSVSFQEKLTSWNIQTDRTMANAWVGYEFWLNGEFSHCGINSFQLINFDGEWKIIYLIDTRGKEGCMD